MRIRRNFHFYPKYTVDLKEQEPPVWVVRLYEGDPRMGWLLTDWEMERSIHADDAKSAFINAVSAIDLTGYGYLSTASSHREEDPTDIHLFNLRDYFLMYP